MDIAQLNTLPQADTLSLKLTRELGTVSALPNTEVLTVPNVIDKTRNGAGIILVPFQKIQDEAKSYSISRKNPLCVRSVVNNAENIFSIDLPTAAHAVQFQKVIKDAIAAGEVKGGILKDASDMRGYTSGLLFTTSRQRPKYGHVAKWFRDMSWNAYVIETELREIPTKIISLEDYLEVIGRMRRKMVGLVGLETNHIALANVSRKNDITAEVSSRSRIHAFWSSVSVERAIPTTSSAVSRYTVALHSGASKKLSRELSLSTSDTASNAQGD